MKPIFIFDLGKVLVDFDYSIAVEKLRARSVNPPAADVLAAALGGTLLDFETGLITRQAFFDTVRAAAGFSGQFEEFSDHLASIFSPIQPMIELHGELRRQGYRTYIFSNISDLAVGHIRAGYPFFKNFDGYVFSYEAKALKPNPPAYEAVELMCGHRGGDLLYIDDRPENIAAGAQRGWQTILQESPEKTKAELARLGIKI